MLLACKDGKIAYSSLLSKHIGCFGTCMLNEQRITDRVDSTGEDHEAHDSEPESISYFTHTLSVV